MGMLCCRGRSALRWSVAENNQGRKKKIGGVCVVVAFCCYCGWFEPFFRSIRQLGIGVGRGLGSGLAEKIGGEMGAGGVP